MHLFLNCWFCLYQLCWIIASCRLNKLQDRVGSPHMHLCSCLCQARLPGELSSPFPINRASSKQAACCRGFTRIPGDLPPHQLNGYRRQPWVSRMTTEAENRCFDTTLVPFLCHAQKHISDSSSLQRAPMTTRLCRGTGRRSKVPCGRRRSPQTPPSSPSPASCLGATHSGPPAPQTTLEHDIFHVVKF